MTHCIDVCSPVLLLSTCGYVRVNDTVYLVSLDILIGRVLEVLARVLRLGVFKAYSVIYEFSQFFHGGLVESFISSYFILPASVLFYSILSWLRVYWVLAN